MDETPELKSKLLLDVTKASKGLYFLLIIGFLIPYFLISASIIGLCFIALVQYIKFGSQQKIQWKPLLWMSLGIVPFLMGMLNSSESFVALKQLQYHSSYLFVPLALIFLPSLNKKEKLEVFSFFILCVFISTIPVLFQYFKSFQEITHSLGLGKSIPTPVDHVRYSIYLSIALIFSFIGAMQNKLFFNIRKRSIYLFFALYFFVIIHLLAVRSGIVLTYAALLIAGTMMLIQAKKFKIIAMLWVLIIASPVVAYYSFPSFQNKILYSKYDFSRMLSETGSNYSDSERLRSLVLGWKIFKENPIVGVGTGDLKTIIKAKYISAYGTEGKVIYPHNQLLKIAAASGLIGLFIYLLSIYVPFFMFGNYRDPYILSLVLIISISFLAEATLERSYMLALYMVFAGLLYKRK